MKRTISIAAMTLLAAAVGCSNNNAKPTASLQPSNQVTQLTPPQAAAPVDASATPVDNSAPVDTSTPPAMGSEISVGGAVSNGGGTYVVKAGDTLYRISVQHYGSGKDWKKIAAANPGINPTHLRVGQKLTMP